MKNGEVLTALCKEACRGSLTSTQLEEALVPLFLSSMRDAAEPLQKSIDAKDARIQQLVARVCQLENAVDVLLGFEHVRDRGSESGSWQSDELEAAFKLARATLLPDGRGSEERECDECCGRGTVLEGFQPIERECPKCNGTKRVRA